MAEYTVYPIYTCVLRWLSRDIYLRVFGTTRDDMIGLEGMVSRFCCMGNSSLRKHAYDIDLSLHTTYLYLRAALQLARVQCIPCRTRHLYDDYSNTLRPHQSPPKRLQLRGYQSPTLETLREIQVNNHSCIQHGQVYRPASSYGSRISDIRLGWGLEVFTTNISSRWSNEKNNHNALFQRHVTIRTIRVHRGIRRIMSYISSSIQPPFPHPATPLFPSLHDLSSKSPAPQASTKRGVVSRHVTQSRIAPSHRSISLSIPILTRSCCATPWTTCMRARFQQERRRSFMQPACSLCYCTASVAVRGRPPALRVAAYGTWTGCEREVVLRLEMDEGSLHSAV
jgi:hypothetical protein